MQHQQRNGWGRRPLEWFHAGWCVSVSLGELNQETFTLVCAVCSFDAGWEIIRSSQCEVIWRKDVSGDRVRLFVPHLDGGVVVRVWSRLASPA